MWNRNSRTAKRNRQRLALISTWKHVALCVSALAFSALPLHAQQKINPQFGPVGGPVCPADESCAPIPLIPDIAPLKPVVVDVEKCLPWNLSAAQAAASTGKTVKVPSNARGEYQKACEASQKKKPEESE